MSADDLRIAVAGAGSFVVVALLVPYFRRLALAHAITDKPSPRKVHTAPTPYLGGVPIALAAVGWSMTLPGWEGDAAAILGAACLVAVIGLVDDVRTVRPLTRVGVEVVASTIAVAAGAHVELFGGPVDYLLTVVWIVAITNGFNLLDNMDAAVGSIAPTIAIALAVTALLEGQRLVGGLAVVVAATCLAFLIYNWHPARVFMGDAGSLFLGFLLAVISLKLRTDVSHVDSAIAVVLLVGPAVFDTLLVVIARTRAGRPVFLGGKDHTSHRLLQLGFRHGAVIAILVGGTTLSCALGVAVAHGLVSGVVVAPPVLLAGFLALVFLLGVATESDVGPTSVEADTGPVTDESS